MRPSDAVELLPPLKQPFAREIFQRLTAIPGVLSVTFVGSFCDRQDLSGISDIDVVVICESLEMELFNHCSAVMAGVSPEIEKGLADYGTRLGTAFQLIDDVLDYSGDTGSIGKNLGDDLAEGKPTLPLIHAMRTGTAAQAELIRGAIMHGGREDFAEIVAAIDATGALAYARKAARSEADAAQAAIRCLPESSAKATLVRLADYAVVREN